VTTKKQGWDLAILSEPEYDHLVAEVSFDGQFLLLLDREKGRDALYVAFPDSKGALSNRIALDEFIEKLGSAAADLRR
jgi:hypothetical protein